MVIPLLRNEIAKACRTKLPYFGFFAASLVCLLTFVVAGETGSAENLNAWGYLSLSMQLVFTDIGLIFITIFSAMLIAEETGSGTARVVLSCPVLRWELYVAKVLVGLFYAVIMLIISLIVSVCFGALNYQFSDVTDTMGLIYSRKEVIMNFILTFFLSWIPLAAVVTYGVLLSAIIRKPGQAVAAAIGVIYLVDFTKHIIGVDSYIFTRYIGYSWRVFNQIAQGVNYQWTPEVWRMIVMSVVYCAITFTIGLIVFTKRDLNV